MGWLVSFRHSAMRQGCCFSSRAESCLALTRILWPSGTESRLLKGLWHKDGYLGSHLSTRGEECPGFADGQLLTTSKKVGIATMARGQRGVKKHVGRRGPRRAVTRVMSDVEMLETDNDTPPPPSTRSRAGRGRTRGRGGGSDQGRLSNNRQSHNSIAYNNNSDHPQTSYNPRIETFNPNCQECASTSRLNTNLRVKLDRLLGACRDAMERWADDVGVGTGLSMEPMEWRPEMTTLVLERVRRPSEFQSTLPTSSQIPAALLPTHSAEGLAGQQRQQIQTQEQTGLQQQQQQQLGQPQLPPPQQQSQGPSPQCQHQHLPQRHLQIHLKLQPQTPQGSPTEPLVNQLILHQQQPPQQPRPQSSSISTYPRAWSESSLNGIGNLLALWDGGSSTSFAPSSAGSGTSKASSASPEAAHISAHSGDQNGVVNVNANASASTNANVTAIAAVNPTDKGKTVDYPNWALAG